MTAPHPPQLDYAQTRSLVARIGARRFIVYAIMLATAMTIALAYDPLVRRVKRWHAHRAFLDCERQCLRYGAPAERIVYEEDPTRAAALMASDPAAYAAVTVYDQIAARPVQPTGQIPVQHDEPLWSLYNNAGAVQAQTFPRTVAFLHERTSKSGDRRLVAVEFTASAQRVAPQQWTIFRVLIASAFQPGKSPMMGPGPAQEMFQINLDAARPLGLPAEGRSEPFSVPAPLRLYAGQPDPADPTRFTIPYDVAGVRGSIAGVLGDDGRVILTPDAGRNERATNAVGFATWVPPLPP